MSRNEDYLDNLLTSVTDKLNEFDDDFEQNRESLKESYQTQNDLPSKTQSALDEIREENFIKEFEDELRSGGTEDDFLREFEKELSGEADSLYTSPQTDDYVNQMEDIMDRSEKPGAGQMPMEVDTLSQADTELDNMFRDDPLNGNLDDILDQLEEPATSAAPDQSTDNFLDAAAAANLETADQGTGEEVISQMAKEQEDSMAAPEGMEGLEDIFGDLLDGDADGLINELENGISQSSGQDSASETPEPALDDNLEQILNESDDDALSEIDKLLDTDAGEAAQAAAETPEKTEAPAAEDTFAMGPDFSFEESSIDTEKQEKKEKEKKPNGFFGKISHTLFGTPEELDPKAAAEYEAAKAAMGLNEETDPKVLKEKKKQEKELKKQQKKEEAEKKKQEKDAAKAEKKAKKAAKPKKEKKPKKKNQVPKEPPLPKVPVMMMWILALSMMLLIFLGSSLVGYSSSIKESKEAFENGDYVTAYIRLQGVKVKDADKDLLQASSALAGVQTELDAYNALMEHKQYELALDALVRGYGRCQIHSAEAEEWNVSQQLTEMENKFDQLLKEQFDVSKRKAKKLYKIKKRSEYTLALQEILANLGLMYTHE